jgi:surface carbohydrate biosynthesis protein
MNIYLHIEISSRELDSKLLLATLAASRGHQVIVSDLFGILKGVHSGVLTPGIFHTKSLTPGKTKIAIHKNLIDKGFKITSIDEEGNLNEYGYHMFANQRYSDKTIEQSSAVFGWGSEDVETLKQMHPKHSNKIYKTGSPRVDLWKSFFSDYWDISSLTPSKPFLLIASNLGYANNTRSFKEYISYEKQIGRFERDPDLLKKRFGETAEDYNKFFAYIEAIQYLSNHNKGYDIVLRPHPAEDIETWKIFLKDIPNVHIIRDGSISAWVKNSFAVMHNSCTTALEATVSKKPVITYIPFEQQYDSKLANELGYRVKSLDELLNRVNIIFEDRKVVNKKELDKQLPNQISKKLYFDNDELAAEKMIKIWENIDNKNFSNSSNLKNFELLFKFHNFKQIIKKILKRLLPFKLNSLDKNPKFPPLDKRDINKKVKKFEDILGINEKLECKFLSEKTIHIKRL